MCLQTHSTHCQWLERLEVRNNFLIIPNDVTVLPGGRRIVRTD